MYTWSGAALFLFVGLSTVAAISGTRPSTVASAPGAFVQRCYKCENCSGTSGEAHKMIEVTGHGTAGKRGKHGCLDVACAQPACTVDTSGTEMPGDDDEWEEGQEPSEFDALVASAFRGEVGAVERLLVDYPERAWYDVARNALQLRGCSAESVAGHLPLDTAQQAAAVSVLALALESPWGA